VNCEELLKRLTDYQEQALPPGLCRELEEHLSGCDHCRALEEDLEALRRLCRECPSPRLPEALRRRMRSMLEGQ
jgi:anti-sigma factor RsiW